MSNGIAKIVDGNAVAWAPLHDGNRCVTFFGAQPVPDPLPEGYVRSDTFQAAWSAGQQKRSEVDVWWKTTLAEGYVVTSIGVEIGWSEVDRQVVSQGIALLNESLMLGLIAPTDPIPGWVDRHGEPIVVAGADPTAAQLKLLALEMGQAFQSQRGLWLAYRAAIAAGNVSFVVGEPLLEEGA
ncbi:hypothetical protein AB1L30_05300 [Bremerella sp. JC817]|uniref:hypothetical protein n=1 Tax=Bremerella sp. JC817 TaxID=3231756 RepID=UPI0034588A11